MSPFQPYRGDRYLDLDELEAWLLALCDAHPRWFRMSEAGSSLQGRPLTLVTVGDHEGDVSDQPGFWLDGGTHASEWTGVMSCLFTLSTWAEALASGDEAMQDRFSRTTAYVLPCISPDGYDALRRGLPFLRSALRPPRPGQPRQGLDPQDIDGDGVVRWMRWRSPAGPWTFPTDNPARMAHRTLDTDPDDCWFVASEGQMLEWDGARWEAAPRRYGLDLNRNFPASWTPFQMFGMDGGSYPMSAPESRAVVETFAARPRIASACTNHTYTGCLLTQPYRHPSPLGSADIDLMERLADGAVAGTGYRVIRVHPDFAYDPEVAIPGVWADAMATTFGVPAYTLELWDPYGQHGLEVETPARFFKKPDVELVGKMLDGFRALDPDAITDWVEFDHPQLGPVQIGGLRYLTTVRNPPESLLPAECAKGHAVADRLCRAVPDLRLTAEVVERNGAREVQVLVENRGYLGTDGLQHARGIGRAPTVQLTLEGAELMGGERRIDLGHLTGWGAMQSGAAAMPLYPALPDAEGPRAAAKWVVRGDGPLTVRWEAGRGGCGVLAL